ncbi:hypothetical protein BUALT_Bualt01G0148300 [Buddleja alternifolia]|uniref:Retrotransposon gag domain-containing protein n=1 Tax=Buddleja alternifolia TaxID=168488 RepID=A0AAV6YF00_9LAMI|nr:hypothetical protein BUALT_Bualt01G0148300 [Buddleja alternifolia]
MAEGLGSLDYRKEIDAIKEQLNANAAKSDRMFEDIRNIISAMEANRSHVGGSAGTMDQEEASPTCEQYFKVDDTPFDAKVRLAAIHMEGRALQWHQLYMKARNSRELPRWEEYVKALQYRFDSLLFEDPMAELMNLRQTGTVRDYLDKFDELLNNVNLNEAYAISCFLDGLKNEITVQVRMFKPKSLQEAMSLAKLQEQAIMLADKRVYSNSRTQSTFPRTYTTNSTPIIQSAPSSNSQDLLPKTSNPMTNSAKPGKRLTPQELEEKRAKGLCFLCDEKYSREHVCTKKGQLFLLEMGDDRADDEDHFGAQEEDGDLYTPTCDIENNSSNNFHISMTAINGIHDFSTMRVNKETRIYFCLEVCSELRCDLVGMVAGSIVLFRGGGV